jgi:uncharacterized repeat protein (TIGR02543 family)
MKNLKFLFLIIFVFLFLGACGKSYTVEFVTNTDEEVEARIADKDGKIDLPTLTKEGYDFKGWYKDSNFTSEFTEDDLVTEDLTLYAKWDIKKYEVKFLDGSKELAKVTVEHGKDATAPANPTKEGYTFKGWDKAFTNVKQNLVVYAQFELLTFEVKFMVDGVQLGETQVVDYGSAATAPTNPTKEGHTFKGWDKEFANVHEDLVINALFEINTYTVTFVDKDGTVLKTETVEYGKDATAPANPTKEGYTFKEWNKAFTNIKANTTVMATYDLIEYAIEYYEGSTKLTLTPAKYTIEDAFDLPEYEKQGFLFVGWYLKSDLTGEKMTKIVKGETGKVVLYAKVLDESITHDIVYELNGGMWGWTVNPVTSPNDGIAEDSNLPVIFMQDFYTWLKDNDLLNSDAVDPALRKLNWADFSANYDDPVAIYNWASSGSAGGVISDLKGYSQYFVESGTGNTETGEITSLVGGFLGTPGYKEKYATLTQHLAYLVFARNYGATSRFLWEGGQSESAAGFILDGYFYGTQDLRTDNDYFNALRGVIPTPDKGYKYVNNALVEYTYDFLKDSMVAGTEVYLSIPSKEGFMFAGWYDNPEFNGERIYKIAEGQEPASKYYAKWVPLA